MRNLILALAVAGAAQGIDKSISDAAAPFREKPSDVGAACEFTKLSLRRAALAEDEARWLTAAFESKRRRSRGWPASLSGRGRS
jgi:hypothetical protein